MIAARKLMEKCFAEKDLKFLDDKMPDFHLRRKEDLKTRASSKDGGATDIKDEIEINLDENQGTIHAVRTGALAFFASKKPLLGLRFLLATPKMPTLQRLICTFRSRLATFSSCRSPPSTKSLRTTSTSARRSTRAAFGAT